MAKFWVNLVVKPNGYIQLLNLGRWVGKQVGCTKMKKYKQVSKLIGEKVQVDKYVCTSIGK